MGVVGRALRKGCGRGGGSGEGGGEGVWKG